MSFPITQASNKRLCIFGKFSDKQPENAGKRFFFTANPNGTEEQGHYELNAENLFRALEPELRQQSGQEHIFIGDTRFSRLTVETPARTGRESTKLPINFDSLLLGESIFRMGADMDSYGTVGEQLFGELLFHTDRMTQRSSPDFIKKAVRLLHDRKLGLAPDVAQAMVNESNLQKFILGDIPFRKALLAYLFAIPEDETELREALRTCMNDAPPDVLTGGDSKAKSEQIQRLLDALSRLKAGIRSATANEASSDDILLRDYLKSCEWVTRFSRCSLLHSFVFCWLTAKYDNEERDVIKGTSLNPAGEKMSRLSIQEQGLQRQVRMSEKLLADVRNVVRKAAREAVEESALEDEDKEELARKLGPEIQNITETHFASSFAFERDHLQKRLEDLFVDCCELALQGPQGRLFAELREEFAAREKQFDRLLRKMTERHAKKRLAGGVDDTAVGALWGEDEQDELKGLLGEIGINTEDLEEGLPEKTMGQLQVEIQGYLAAASFRPFVENYGENLDAIKEKREEYRALYRLHRKAFVESKADGREGLPQLFVEAQVAGPSEVDNERGSLEAVLKTAAAATPPPLFEVDAPGFVQKFFDEQTTEIKGEIQARDPRDEQGKPVFLGTMTMKSIRDADGKSDGKVSYEVDRSGSGTDIPDLEDKVVEVVLPSPQGSDEEQESEAVLFEEQTGHKPREYFCGTRADAPVDQYGALEEHMRELHKQYEDSAGDANKAHFRRKMRAICLGETIDSAGTRVRLGLADVSNVAGVLLELVENMKLPNESNVKDIATAATEDDDLRQINLSRYYPISDDDLRRNKMATIIQYHRDLCTSFVTDVKEHLRDLKELSNAFDALAGSDLEIQLINMTLGEYSCLQAQADIVQDEYYFVGRTPSVLCESPVPPAIVFLTSAAGLDSASLNTHARGMNCGVLDVLAGGSGSGVLSEGSHGFLPVYVSKHALKQTALPFICPADGSLPKLATQATATHLGVSKLLESNPVLLWAAALLADTGDFGESEAIPPRLTGAISETLGRRWRKGGSLFDYLKRCWQTPSDYAALFKLVRLLNAALESGMWSVTPGKDLKPFLAHLAAGAPGSDPGTVLAGTNMSLDFPAEFVLGIGGRAFAAANLPGIAVLKGASGIPCNVTSFGFEGCNVSVQDSFLASL